MKYQLVLQLPYDGSVANYDRLIELEERAMEKICDKGVVDGHDCGCSEMNIFVHTNEPRAAFELLKGLFEPTEQTQLKVGHRSFEEDTYTPIFPIGLQTFSVA